MTEYLADDLKEPLSSKNGEIDAVEKTDVDEREALDENRDHEEAFPSEVLVLVAMAKLLFEISKSKLSRLP